MEEDDREEVTSTTHVSQHAEKASSIYPEATKGSLGSTIESAKPIGNAPKSKTSTGMSAALILLVVGLVVGILLGRTVFKAAPTEEEAIQVLTDGLAGELSQQFDALDE